MKNCPYCKNPIYDSVKRCMFCGRNLDFELAKKLERERVAREELNRTFRITFLAILFIAITTVVALWAAIYSPFGSIANQAAKKTAAAVRYCDPQEVGRSANQLIDFNDRWADIMALAVSVDRDAVVLHVDRLQKIRRDAKVVQTPGCMERAKGSLVDGMQTHIDGLLAYMRDEPLERVNMMITQGNMEMNFFADEVETLQRCAPDCY